MMTHPEYVNAVATLSSWADAYYRNDAPLASDWEYDKLYHAVLEFEKAYPNLVLDDSPTRRVGSRVLDGFEKRAHAHPMLSLRDAFDEDEINKFIFNLEKEHGAQHYFCELKYDGASLNLRYVNGMLESAITRGDGTQGEDVTESAKVIRGIPHSIPSEFGLPSEFEIRGEVVMTFETFERQNEIRLLEGKEKFANPRNAASGSLRQLDIGEVARRGLLFIPYELKSDMAFKTQEGVSRILDDTGLFYDAGYKRLCHNAWEVVRAYRDMAAMRSSLGFGIDGMVIKVNDRNAQEEIGYATKYPKWALAAKFEAVEMTTKLLDVVWQVGKTGIAPVAILEPVLIDGSTVSKATLHNYDEIVRLDLRIGDTVTVFKAGDIIPAIGVNFPERRSGSERKIEKPTHCPSCGTELVGNTLKDGTAGTQLLCTSSNCGAKRVRYLTYIADRTVLNIDGLGESVAEKLVSDLGVKDIFGLLLLNVDDLLRLEGFKQKSAEKLYSAIQGVIGSITLDKLIVLLQPADIGRSISKKLVDALGFDAIDPEMVESFRLSGISDKVFSDYAQLLRQRSDEVALMVELLAPLVPQKKAASASGGALAGMKIVITGKLDRPRKDYADLIEQHGGIFADKISKDVSLLVLGENVGASKIEKAMKMGIEMVHASQWALLQQ